VHRRNVSKKQHIAVLQTLVYFDPPLNDVIQETEHRLLTGYKKPIIGYEKNEFHIPTMNTVGIQRYWVTTL